MPIMTIIIALMAKITLMISVNVIASRILRVTILEMSLLIADRAEMA